MKKTILMTIILSITALSLLLVGCATQVNEQQHTEPMEDMRDEMMGDDSPGEMMGEEHEDESSVPPASSDWKDTKLTDVLTGKDFRISDFKGKQVLIESFAVWCPTCRKQQDQFKALHEELGDTFVSVALDTDPNEDASKVKAHAERNGFEWYFAVSPVELSQSLIDEFGISVVNAPSAPVILVCEDQSTRLLGRGVKDVDRLKFEMEQGCGG